MNAKTGQRDMAVLEGRAPPSYTIRYAVDGQAQEKSGISAEQARAFCMELSAAGIAATEIFTVDPSPR